MRNRIHPITIITGYRPALRDAIKYLNKTVSIKLEDLGSDILIKSSQHLCPARPLGPTHISSLRTRREEYGIAEDVIDESGRDALARGNKEH
ncbi:hypothetical protein EDB82DRAFT_284912 [Fusarium venenatum]|uniref:uncharacterized protein n=1 Tax=Fusarium venenatum TaxID=56646 RepID=UPI001D984A6C|nr:hypothetical protein EDB82DRAFT_284912 [Fusarium venenatum]